MDLFAAFRGRRDRCAVRRCDPLTRPAPAGESAGSEPPSPARGEGWGIREIATLSREGRGLRELRKTVNDG
jgi:hypothetical protein